MARRRSSGVTSLSFNQDQGTEEVGEVTICEMIFRTNWLLVVTARRPCTLLLLDDQHRAFKAEVQFKSHIRALRARRDKVAVVLSTSVQVLSLPSFQRVGVVRTPLASRPLCSLATDAHAPQLLAAPAHRKGSCQLLDVSRVVNGATSSSPAVIGCHQSDLVCLSVAPNGAKLATASERGTIIRIWDTHSKLMLQELRRGSDYADVYCINFNPAGTLVSCVSDKGTLHVWSARGAYNHIAAHALRETASSKEAKALCAVRDDQSAVVICEDGTFHKFTFSPEGSCHRSDFEYFLQVGDDDEFMR